MDKLEFLDGSSEPKGEAVSEAPAVEAPVAEAPAPEPAAQPEANAEPPKQPRGPDGKFARKEADEPVMVPLKALQEVRDELKAFKAQAQTQQPQPQAAPDIFENPEGYQAHVQQTVQQAILNTTLNLSEEMVTQQVGAETVEAAKQWATAQFQANPALYQQFISQRNPYGFLVQQYQRETSLQKLGNDPKEIEAFLAWKAAQQQLQQQPPAQQAQPQPTPPPSIASAPSAGGVQTIATGAGVAFDNFIK